MADPQVMNAWRAQLQTTRDRSIPSALSLQGTPVLAGPTLLYAATESRVLMNSHHTTARPLWQQHPSPAAAPGPWLRSLGSSRPALAPGNDSALTREHKLHLSKGAALGCLRPGSTASPGLLKLMGWQSPLFREQKCN